MNQSVLEKEYSEPDRPYSQKELREMKQHLYRRYRIGKVMIKHPECGHFYLAKVNGRKEREAIESEYTSMGNCSVCWKVSRTPRKLKNVSKQLITDYCSVFKNDPTFWTFEVIELETYFYTWLYNEFNPEQPKTQ